MHPCPRCGSELVISYPLGPTMWVETCSACGYEGGGTISFPPQIANDDLPILIVYVVDSGPQRFRLFSLYRRVLKASPARAKVLLDTTPVEIARGPRMLVERCIKEFQTAGATLRVVAEPEVAPDRGGIT